MEGFIVEGFYPPRIPPTGFLGLGVTPTCEGASARRTALDDSNRVCVLRGAFRAIKAQLRTTVMGILLGLERTSASAISARAKRGHFPARALGYDRDATFRC